MSQWRHKLWHPCVLASLQASTATPCFPKTPQVIPPRHNVLLHHMTPGYHNPSVPTAHLGGDTPTSILPLLQHHQLFLHQLKDPTCFWWLCCHCQARQRLKAPIPSDPQPLASPYWERLVSARERVMVLQERGAGIHPLDLLTQQHFIPSASGEKEKRRAEGKEKASCQGRRRETRSWQGPQKEGSSHNVEV